MESFVYPPFGKYQSFRGGLTPSRSREPAVKQPSWKQNKSSSISPFLGGPLSPMPSEYLDSYRRAQFQALLSQVSPGLMPRLRRANTKEVGVQVNLRADAAVQCSLGPRLLPLSPPLSPAALRIRGHLALYSPVLDRRLFTLPEATGPREKDEASEATPKEQKAEDGGEEQQEGQAEAALLSEETAETPQEKAAAPRRRAAFQVCSEERLGHGAACSGQQGSVWGENRAGGWREICPWAVKRTVVPTLAACSGLCLQRGLLWHQWSLLPVHTGVMRELGWGFLWCCRLLSELLSAVFGAEVWLFPL